MLQEDPLVLETCLVLDKTPTSQYWKPHPAAMASQSQISFAFLRILIVCRSLRAAALMRGFPFEMKRRKTSKTSLVMPCAIIVWASPLVIPFKILNNSFYICSIDILLLFLLMMSKTSTGFGSRRRSPASSRNRKIAPHGSHLFIISDFNISNHG